VSASELYRSGTVVSSLTRSSYLLHHHGLIEVQEHRRAALLCLQYLNLDCLDLSLTDTEVREFALRGSYSFLDYALPNWLKHIELSALTQAAEDSATMENIVELIEGLLSRHWTGNELPDYTMGAPKYLEVFRGREIYNKLCLIANFERTTSDTTLVLDLNAVLRRSRQIIEQIATEESYTSDGSDLDLSIYYGSDLFKCTKKGCQYFYLGFSSVFLRDKHVRGH
jgi:hypothetical protein